MSVEVAELKLGQDLVHSQYGKVKYQGCSESGNTLYVVDVAGKVKAASVGNLNYPQPFGNTPKRVRRPGDNRQSYVQKLLKSRRPTEWVEIESAEFVRFARRLSQDSKMRVSFSASETLTVAFRNDYERRSGTPLVSSGRVHEDTLGIKLNVECSKATVEGIRLSGISFESFFGSETIVLGHGDRAGLWWGLIDLGFRVGNQEAQDQERIQSQLYRREN